MGMFDWYEPVPEIRCPVCERALREWQGKDGPCALFVWRQGCTEPVAHRVDDDAKLPAEAIVAQRLPPQFEIYSDDCECPFLVEAVGTTSGGVWTTTIVVSIENATQKRHERRADWKARRAWLARRGGA